jgi:anti-sigma factor ChrR (cupin superfamily)
MEREDRMLKECEERLEPYVLGLLSPRETAAFEGHLAQCEACRSDLARTNLALAEMNTSVPPRAETRGKVLDFTYAPRTPLNLRSYAWEEIAPGVRVYVFRDDLPRGVRAQLMWSDAGAARPKHLHVGDEEILVLQGSLVVSEGEYEAGEICRVEAGRFHEERANGSSLVCYVVHRPPAKPTTLSAAPDTRCLRCVFYPLHSGQVAAT